MSVYLVHDEAETMEHFLTPEIEEEILGELGLCSRFNPLLEIHAIIPDPDIAYYGWLLDSFNGFSSGFLNRNVRKLTSA